MLDVTKFSMARLLDMVAYLREGKRFEKSSAVLMVLSDLGCFWKLVKLFIVVPAFVRYLKIGHPQEGQLQHRKPPPPRTTQRKKPRNTKVTGLD